MGLILMIHMLTEIAVPFHQLELFFNPLINPFLQTEYVYGANRMPSRCHTF